VDEHHQKPHIALGEQEHPSVPPDGWFSFGSFVEYDFPLDFLGVAEDGLPLFERPCAERIRASIALISKAGYANGFEDAITAAQSAVANAWRDSRTEQDEPPLLMTVRNAIDATRRKT